MSVRPDLWDESQFLSLSSDAKLVWLYLISGPHTVAWVPGLLLAGLSSLGEGLRLKPAVVGAALDRLVDYSWVEVDHHNRIVRIPKAPKQKHNQPRNGNVVRGWFRRWVALPPASPLKYLHVSELEKTCGKFEQVWEETFQSVMRGLAGTNSGTNPETNSEINSQSEINSIGVLAPSTPRSVASTRSRSGSEDASQGLELIPRSGVLASYLLDSIRKHDPSFVAPGSLRPWADSIAGALAEGYTETQIRAAIDWSQHEEFWRAIVVHGQGLCKHLDKLLNQARRAGMGSRPSLPRVEIQPPREGVEPASTLREMTAGMFDDEVKA